LITTGMDAGLLQARFYIGADDLSRLSSPLMLKQNSAQAAGGTLSRGV
jgi:hypothetical protein